MRIFKKLKVKKLSGYLFLKLLLENKEIKNKKFFLINPTLAESKKNYQLLRSKGFYKQKFYVAPMYNLSNYKDLKIINLLNLLNPDFIIINLGGGIQEPIAEFLRQRLRKKKVVILCTGAAISFLTKEQAPISQFYDEYYLGWLIRLIHKPKSFFPRILKSFYLIKFFKN